MTRTHKGVGFLLLTVFGWSGRARHKEFPSFLPTGQAGASRAASQYIPSSDLLREQAQVRRAGLPLDAAQLMQPLPPEQNAAPVYKQLTQLLAAHPLTSQDAILNRITGERMPSRSQCEQIRGALLHRQDVMRLIHQAAARPQCVFNRDYSLGMELTFPEYVKMREAIRILSAESTLLLHDGKPLEAIRNETQGFRIAQHSAQDPFLIANLVGIALDAITLKWMTKCLYASADRPEIVQAVRSAIEANYRPHRLSDALRGELVLVAGMLHKLRREGPDAFPDDDGSTHTKASKAEPAWKRPADWDAQIDANETYYLQRMQEAIQAADLPYIHASPIFNKLRLEADKKKDDAGYVYSAAMMPVYTQNVDKQAQLQARREVVRCASAVLVWGKRHGAFPNKLEEAISPVPTDPYNAKPLAYRRSQEGFVVYSVGSKAAFEGGVRNTKPKVYQTYFWYPMPSFCKE